MDLTFRAPGPMLSKWIESFWYCHAPELGSTRERVLPSGRALLLVNLADDRLSAWQDGKLSRSGGAALEGARTQAVIVDTAEQARIVGVSFRAGGSYPFFAPSAGALADETADLDALWGASARSTRARLLEQPDSSAVMETLESILLERIVRPLTRESGLDRAIRAIERGMLIREVADQMGSSQRRLLRAFEREVGLSPKRYARVRRFQAAIGAINRGEAVAWSTVAHDCGYYDQAHFIHEFKEFSGMRPSDYRPRQPHANHVPIDAADADRVSSSVPDLDAERPER